MKRFQMFVAIVALVGLSTTAWAQQQRGRGDFGQGGPAGLVAIPAVQEELNLTADQKQKLEAARGDRSSLRDLSREERQKKIQEMAKKAEETIKTVLDEKQQKRLEELHIQSEGGSALVRAEVAEKLGLEQAQKDKIKQIQQQNASTDRASLRNATQEERRKAFAEARERREKMNADLLAVLTPAQKESFEKMQGEKFEFPRRGRRQNQ